MGAAFEISFRVSGFCKGNFSLVPRKEEVPAARYFKRAVGFLSATSGLAAFCEAKAAWWMTRSV